MNRRTLALGLYGAAAFPLLVRLTSHPALAQPADPKGPVVPLNAEEWKHKTLVAGGFSKQTSEIALQKATNPKVKQFATFEDAEQNTIAEVLTSLLNPPAPPAPDAAHATVLKQLQSASGADFDKAYIQAQMDGHTELLTIQNSYLQGKGQETQSMLATDTAHIALLAKTVIEMHITMLGELHEMVRG